MSFKVGVSGNPRGRPKGSHSGRIKALVELDRLMSLAKNRKALGAAFQEQFSKDPAVFFRTYIMPLLPKESKVAVDHDGVMEWKSLVEAFPVEGEERQRLEGGGGKVEDGEEKSSTG